MQQGTAVTTRIFWQEIDTVYIDDSTTDFKYDMIIICDLLNELGIILNFGAGMMIWQDISVSMKFLDASIEELYHICDNPINPE